MQLYFAPIFPKTLQVRMERNLTVFSGDLICHFDFCAHANICDFQLSEGLEFAFLPDIFVRGFDLLSVLFVHKKTFDVEVSDGRNLVFRRKSADLREI